MRLLTTIIFIAVSLAGGATSLVAAPDLKISRLTEMPPGFDVTKLQSASAINIFNDGTQEITINVNGHSIGAVPTGWTVQLVGRLDEIEIEAILERKLLKELFSSPCSSTKKSISLKGGNAKLVRVENFGSACAAGTVRFHEVSVLQPQRWFFSYFKSKGTFGAYLIGFNSLGEMAKAETEFAQRIEAERLAREKAEDLKKAEADLIVRQNRERIAAETAPLPREELIALRAELQELLKKKEFDAAAERYNASCTERKVGTLACRFLRGYMDAEKARGAGNAKELIVDARSHLEAAFNGEDAEISALAATVLLPLLDNKGEDAQLEKAILAHLAGSEFATTALKSAATKRLAEIEAKEARSRKAEEVAAERKRIREQKRAEAQERAEKLAQKREEAERQRQEKIESARQEAEARRGDGTTEDLTCKRLGHKPTTPNYISCRKEFAGKAERERTAQEQSRERIEREREAANRGDGTRDHQTCYRYGFKLGTDSYAGCRQRLDIAKQQMDQQQEEYERKQRLYEQQQAAYERQREIQRERVGVEILRRLAGGQSLGNSVAAATGMAPIAPQLPVMENYNITMPGGRMVTCSYIPATRNMNCF